MKTNEINLDGLNVLAKEFRGILVGVGDLSKGLYKGVESFVNLSNTLYESVNNMYEVIT